MKGTGKPFDPKTFTKDEIELICSMIANGITQQRISKIFKVSHDLLSEQICYHRDLLKGAKMAYARRTELLAKCLWERAHSGIENGKNQSIAIFMAKTQLGWQEKDEFHVKLDVTHKTEEEIKAELDEARAIEESIAKGYLT